MKKITYFQKGDGQSDSVLIAKTYIPKIQTGDILSVYVNSLSVEASSFFNPYSANVVATPGADGGLSQGAAPGYLVDASGKIVLPLVGSILLKGLNINEAQDSIKNRLLFYLKEPTVNVRFLNYKISILGEVARPGVYVIPNQQITIPEAITMAGDLTNYSLKNDVEIIRDVNNKKEFGTVDLTNRNLFSSPYYYLHANDIIYVKPSKFKASQSDLLFRLVPITISVVSVLILILSKI